MKRFALLGTALMSFLTGCGTQQENTASSQTMPKTAASADSMKEIARTGMSTAVPDDYLQPIEQAGTVTQITYDSKDFVRDESDIHFSSYIPESYDGSEPYALFVTLHGWEGLYFQGVGANLGESYPFEARNYNDKMIVLSTHIPFNTHMGSHDGGTYDTIRELEPNATVIMNGLPVEMKTAETGAAKQVEKWLKSLNI